MALIKVCGLTRIADLKLCLRLGADYVGAIVEIERSPRSLSRQEASQLLRCARGQGVIVTKSADDSSLAEFARDCDLAAIQLHGAQGPAFVETLAVALPKSVEVWLVLGMPADAREAEASVADLIARTEQFAAAGAAKVVLDSKVKGLSGGTGVPMNWELAAHVISACPVSVLLAGGIAPGNAVEALRASGAAGLDVSSGVEASPGVKSPAKLRELLAAAKE